MLSEAFSQLKIHLNDLPPTPWGELRLPSLLARETPISNPLFSVSILRFLAHIMLVEATTSNALQTKG